MEDSDNDHKDDQSKRILLCHHYQLATQIALYSVAQSMLSIPSGIRSMYTSPFRGMNLTADLLDPDSHEQRLRNMTRMRPDTFMDLIDWLRDYTTITEPTDPHAIHIEQKLLIFLYITTQGVAYRSTAEMFHHSTDTISKTFHEVLKALCELYDRVVHLPACQMEYSKEALSDNFKIWPFFKGCIGALDGTHLPIAVPARQQSSWRNRKGFMSQNVLAACDHSLNFVYIYAGMEGSSHDSRVLAQAQSNDNFTATSGCYFLADAGYSRRIKDVLVPYSEK
ncbi:hypothetical protein ACJ73_07609 [Blastomyces percursus]|uniref:Uncharacterized protein n=1 Tax=Blastomyces percursus TaxID=1658174 RepID=A0A1J9QYY1_9EURO|nr:hypothetical protein ACJ73_07609 [Blastomyces percursus]